MDMEIQDQPVLRQPRRRKIIITSIVVLGVIAGCIFVVHKRADALHTTYRRNWKDDAIAAINRDLKNSGYLKERFGEVPKPMGDFETASEEEWLTDDTIVCRDATWMAYRAETWKADPELRHDIFIAKASDGTWYYSDFHFCKGMMVLAGDEQPASLEDFRHRYFLEEFDGASDQALERTWTGEIRYAAQGE